MKIKIFALITLLALAFTGCANGDQSKEGSLRFQGEPDYEQYVGERVMMISGYWAPRHTLEQFQWAKECGFTHLYLESKYGNPGTEEYAKALELADQVGLKIIAQRVSKSLPFTEDKVDYSQYECFAGHNVWDEPGKEDFATIAGDLDIFQERYPDGEAEFYTNLFPLYASSAQTGYDTFEEYVDEFCKQVVSKIKYNRSISCDSYPLRRDSSRKINYLRSGHLVSLNTIARAAVKYDAKPYFFIQSMDYGTGNRAPLKADFALQVNTAFAFGIQGIQHFTYMTPQDAPGGEFLEGQTALIDREGNKTERWAYAQEINREIAAFDHVYLSFDWKGVMTVRGENENDAGDDFEMLKGVIKTHERVKQFSSTEDTLMGVFTDENGYDGFMVTPYRETTDNATATVTLSFNEADSAAVWQKGEKRVEKLNGGTLTLVIEPGDGAFVIPFNEVA